MKHTIRRVRAWGERPGYDATDRRITVAALILALIFVGIALAAHAGRSMGVPL